MSVHHLAKSTLSRTGHATQPRVWNAIPLWQDIQSYQPTSFNKLYLLSNQVSRASPPTESNIKVSRGTAASMDTDAELPIILTGQEISRQASSGAFLSPHAWSFVQLPCLPHMTHILRSRRKPNVNQRIPLYSKHIGTKTHLYLTTFRRHLRP